MLCKQEKEKGYTLVEFVIMTSILGTISLLVFPSYENITNRFKQTEAVGIINSMIKAAQSHYALFGYLPEDMGAVSKYAKFNKCPASNAKTEGSLVCRRLVPVAVKSNDVFFYSPSGNYKVEMRRVYTLNENQIFQAKANPNGGKYLKNGSAVVGCFNSSNGMTQIVEYSSKSSDRGVKSYIKCSTNLVLFTEAERQERLEQERLEQERLEKERQERLEQERLENERQERLEAERLRRRDERKLRDLRRRRRR